MLGYTEHLSPPLSLLMDEFSSLHCTLLTLLPPRGPCDFTSHRVHRTWLGLMPHGPADAPPTPPLYLHLPDGSWRSGSWSMPTNNYSYTLSYSLNVLLLCNDSSWSHDIYSSVYHGEGSSSVVLLKVSSLLSPWKFSFSIFYEFLLIRCEVKGQGCLCVQIVKPSEENL